MYMYSIWIVTLTNGLFDHQNDMSSILPYAMESFQYENNNLKDFHCYEATTLQSLHFPVVNSVRSDLSSTFYLHNKRSVGYSKIQWLA